MRYQYYFNTALSLLEKYHGTMPLVHYLKAYFSEHKKHGSKDRKHISHLCYTYYRLGLAAKTLAASERLKIILYICEQEPGVWEQVYTSDWLSHWPLSQQERIAIIEQRYPECKVKDIFPWLMECSDGLDGLAFNTAYFRQPDLFIRIRPGHAATVLSKLQASAIPYTEISPNALALPNTTRLDAILDINKEVVIQDYSSQRIAELLSMVNTGKQKEFVVWDCCAASGGKSILATDVLPLQLQLIATDARMTVLKNLQKRFEQAGLVNYSARGIDLTKKNEGFPLPNADLVICDVPCSGSGTWGRTPEQLYFFSTGKISIYAALQQQIVNAVLPAIKPGGWLLYSTCSVFKKENEAMVAYILEKAPSLQLVTQQCFTGYTVHADTMFAALFQKKV